MKPVHQSITLLAAVLMGALAAPLAAAVPAALSPARSPASRLAHATFSRADTASAVALPPALAGGIVAADSLVARAVSGGKAAGAVLLVSRGGRVVHVRAFGYAQRYDYDLRPLRHPVRMRITDLFDLASVTKVMATTMAVMMLVDRGRIALDAPIRRYLPGFSGPHKDSVTVRLLLEHAGGLYQWQPLYYRAHDAASTLRAIEALPLKWGVGAGRHYSDLGFMLLGDVVARVTGERLDVFLRDSLYRPLGLRHTTFLPKAHGFRHFAATEQGNGYERRMVYDTSFGYRYRGDPTAWDGWRRYTLVGEVDDGNAWYANGGVAGHAGLFSTAGDLQVLLQLLLDRGRYHGRRYIHAAVVDTFLTRDHYGHALGWMVPPGLPSGSFEHFGFTGTYVLGVPQDGLAVVLLTNRQNGGTDASGRFPDLTPLDHAVARTLVAAAAQSDRAAGGPGS